MLITIKNGIVDNFVHVTEDTKTASIGFLESQGYTVLDMERDNIKIGDLYNAITNEFTPVEPEGNWNISKRAFKNRFPRAKWNYAAMNKDTNPLLYDMLETWSVSSYINLKDEETIYCVTALTYENIPVEARLTAAECDAILVPPGLPEEL